MNTLRKINIKKKTSVVIIAICLISVGSLFFYSEYLCGRTNNNLNISKKNVANCIEILCQIAEDILHSKPDMYADLEKESQDNMADEISLNESQNEQVIGDISKSEKKKIWVVDQEAWSETVQVPVYASKPRWFILFTDGRKEIYYDKTEWINDCKNAPDVSQWGSEKSEVYVSGYEYEVIEHPEKGHWEYR